VLQCTTAALEGRAWDQVDSTFHKGVHWGYTSIVRKCGIAECCCSTSMGAEPLRGWDEASLSRKSMALLFLYPLLFSSSSERTVFPGPGDEALQGISRAKM